MMELRPICEKFESWLRAEDVVLVHQHMAIARMRKKSEYTRAALLAGLPRYQFEQSCQIGELALAVNKLAMVMAAANANAEVKPTLVSVKRLTKILQDNCAREGRAWEGRR